jgi:glycosyltransferase involved in cell wall biosynthesis
VNTERPFADGRHAAVFVFNELRADAGRLTKLWLERVRAFDAAGWATHAALINKDPCLGSTVASLVDEGRLPAATVVHHYAQRDRRVRPSWWGKLPPGTTLDDRIGDWLDWLTGQVPGAVVLADSPAAYPYVARMSNPLIARIAGVHLNHLADDPDPADPASAPLAPRFAERFAEVQEEFDAIVVMTATQAADLRARFGQDTPVVVIPPGVPAPVAGHDVGEDQRPARVASVGPLVAESGHDMAIRALHAVRGTHPDAVLDVVGTGPLADELASMAEGLGMAEQVRFLPGRQTDRSLAQASVTLWTGARESCPLAIIRSLGHGVPVVANDVRYGPAELITRPELGDLARDEAELVTSLDRRLAEPIPRDEVRAAAGALLRRTDPAAVGARWVALATELSDRVCDHRQPSLLTESLSTTTRVVRVPGVLADASGALGSWSCELPGLVEPAGWMLEPTSTGGDDVVDEGEAPAHPHAEGPTREVVVQLRSNALAFVAVEGDRPFRVEFTDGTVTAPLLATAFADRIVASRIGNALMRRRGDGSVWVEPLPRLLYASNVEGRLLVRLDPDSPASDITHAIDWAVDIDWADLEATPQGAAFRGTLRAIGIAPAEDSPPAICVSDVGGFSRIVGQLHYTSEPRVSGLEWSAEVAGVLETAPLVATTDLARGALPLHVGFRGLLVPVGGLWTHGRRTRMLLTDERGEVTLLPSPGGRVLVAPGRGMRARLSGAVRSVVSRA